MSKKVKREFKLPPAQSMYFPDIPFSNSPGYEGILTNESPNHNNLRTKSVQGPFKTPPKKGEPFVILGEPLNKQASLRYVTTSRVESMDYALIGPAVFKTESGSTYRLDYHRVEEV
jgi:hypothetical protein